MSASAGTFGSVDKLNDVWVDRDFPTLLAAARLLEDEEQRPPFQVHEIAAQAGLPAAAVTRALGGLVPGFVVGKSSASFGGDVDWLVSGLTERGRRAVGLWPAGEGVDALVDALRKAEEATEDPEERTLIHRAAGALGTVSREVMADVLAAFVRQQAGL